MTLFTSTLATPIGVAAASTVVEAENVGKTLPASAPSRTTTRVTTQTSSSTEFFDCQGDRGGLLYQVIWEPKGTGNTFELLRYDVDTHKYTVAATYRSKDVPGDADGDGNPNGLSLDSEGRAYVTYARDEFNKVVDLIQLLPDGTTKFIANLRNDPKKIKKNKEISYKDLNAGTYVEENSKPYVVVSNGFANGRGRKVDLTSGAVTDWAPDQASPFGAKEKNVKDYVWVAEGINYRGKTYNIVGLEMNGDDGDDGNVLLASSDPNVKMVTDTVFAPSDYLDTKYLGTYGAAFNFKPGGVISDHPTVVFFSNNDEAFLTQLTWDDSDGDADGSFTLGTLGVTEKTSKNDGGGCPFANLPIAGSVKVWPPDCVLDNLTATGSTFPLEITNDGISEATFKATVKVNGDHIFIDGYRSPVDVSIDDGATKKFAIPIEWGDEMEAEVEVNGQKLAFTPNRGVLNKEACDGKEPPVKTFRPTASASVDCAESGGAVVTVTLDNTESTVAADFTVVSNIGDTDNTEFDGTVEAAGIKELTVSVPHESQWSLEWQASDPNDLDGIPVLGNLPGGGAETVDCPPPDSFAPTAEVGELVCSAPPPHVVTVLLDNTESTVGAAFTVVSNIDGTDNTEYDGTVEAGSVDAVSISIPEDADWSVSWAASDNRDLSDSVEGREPLIFVNTADCTDPPKPEIVGNVYGYVWVDWDKSGTRTGIEDGVEEHVTGAVATLTNTTDYLDETGQLLHGPGGYVRTAITGDGGKGGSDVGDYRWFIADVPVEDNSGNTQEYKVLVDYADATFPSGFVPAGYTVKNNDNVLADEMDSDVAPLAGSIGESATFALVKNLDEHRADAGVVSDLVFDPSAEVTVDCGSGTVQIVLDNTKSTVDANFTIDAWSETRSDANRIDGSGTQVVAGASSSDYDQTISTPVGQVLIIQIAAMAWEDEADIGLGSLQVWDHSISDAPARFCPSIQVIATDCPPTLILDNTQSEVDVVYLLTTVVDGVSGEQDDEWVGPLTTKTVELSSLEEGSTWYLKWVIEDPDDPGRRYEGTVPAQQPGSSLQQFNVDCEPPPFDPSVEISTACSYATASATFAYGTGAIEIRVDNRDSEVEAAVQVDRNGLSVESTTVVAGEISETLEIPGNHGDLFTVNVASGSDTHLYDLKVESGTLDCPDFWVQIVSDDIDCSSNPPTIAITFTNGSETAIDFGFGAQLNAPAGSGGDFLIVPYQRVALPVGGEYTHTFGLKKNWTFNLGWTATTLGTETEWTPSGQFPVSLFGPPVYCPTSDLSFEPVVEITAQCTATGATVTVTVDNTGSEVDAAVTWTYSGGEDGGEYQENVPAGDLFQSEKSAADDETWIVAVRADADTYSGESPVIVSVKVDCPRPQVFLYTECADGKLNVEIDNSDLGFGATLTVTEFLPGGAEGLVVYGPETVTAGVETTVPIDFASGATYTASLTGQGDASYQDVSDQYVVTCPPEEPVIGEFDCGNYTGLIQVIGETDVGFHVKQLSLKTGEYTAIYSIPFDRTPAFGGLNAAGINPVDFVAYGLMKMPGNGAPSYLVRFDKENVAFLARVPEHSAAGAIDDDGTFLWEKVRDLYAIYGVAEMEGFASPDDALDLSGIDPIVADHPNGWVSDIATVKADLGDGEGSYAMGITADRKLGIYRYDDPVGAWAVDLPARISPESGANGSDNEIPGIPAGAFGAAWSHDGRLFFAANSGLGVYEVLIDSIDLDAGTAEVRRVADSEATDWNDGMNCPDSPVCIPDTFGSVYGYVWVDWEASGDRTAIEDGIEEHVSGVTVTVTLESTYLNSKGRPCDDFGQDSWSVQTLGNDSGDYRWQVDGLPAVDGAGNELLYKATFDYRGADFPEGFTPTGYTVRVSAGIVVESELDSDVLPMVAATPSQSADPMVRSLLLSNQNRRLLSTHQATAEDSTGSTLATSSMFTVVDGETVHRADAGVVGSPVFDPGSAITVDCVAESAVVELDNTGSTVEANFKVRAYYGDFAEGDEPDHAGSQLVPPGMSQTYEKAIPPPFGDLLTILVSADAWRNGVPIGQVEFGANDLGVYCDPPFGVMVTAVPDCDAGTVVVTLQNFSPEEMNAAAGTQGVAAVFTATIYRDGLWEQLGDTFGVSGRYDEISAGGVLTKNVTVGEDEIWLVVWTAQDATDSARRFEGILPSADGELFDCVEPVVDPDVTFVVECAVGADDLAAVTIRVDNTRSERAVDVRIKRFGNSSPQQGQVLAGGIKDFYEQDAVHRDKFTIEVTVSDTEPGGQMATEPAAFRDGPGQIRFTTLEVAPQRQLLDLVEVVVQPGDTLSEIAAEHGISMSKLMASNGIDDPGMIRIGQRLTVNVPPASPVVTVEVQPGDTLSEIAAEHGASADLLMLWNGIENPRLIRVGQQLTVGVTPNFDIAAEADHALLVALMSAAELSRNHRATIAEEGDGGQAGVAAFPALVDDIEVDCPNFEPLITARVYCASEMVHIHVFTAGSDIDGYITIYENDTVVYAGPPGPGGLYVYDEKFVYGATYLVEVTADGVTDPDFFEPVTLSEDVDCETPFDPALEVTVDCSNQGPIVKAVMGNTGSDVAVEFTLTLIIDGLDPIQIEPVKVGAGLETSVDVQTLAGIPSVALEDATWRIDWEASGVDAASLSETGNTGSLPTDCVDPVGPFECAEYRAPIQVLLTASGMGYDVSALDVASGSYQVAYTIPFTSADPLYEELNGVGLNPVDSAAYGVMSVYEDGAGSSYLVRFDAERIEYLALMPAMSNSATVDSEGSFLWMVDGSLYRADDIADLVGHVGHNDPRIVDYSNIQPVFNASRAGDLYGHAVDLAHLRVDLGAGETDYVFGVVYGGDQVVAIGYRGADLGRRLLQPVDGASGELSQLQSLEPVEIMVRSGDTLSEIAANHGLTTSELMVMNGIVDASKIRIGQMLTVGMGSAPSEQSTSLPGGGYGAAWNIGGRLLVAANAGGVYELVADDIDLAAETIQVRKVGKSNQSGSNDGMNCPGIPDCFPEVFGDAFGYVWVDWESSGDRTAVEYGIEEHVSGVSVTLANTTAFYGSDGEVCYQPGELVIPSTYTGQGLSSGSDTGDFRWLVRDIPAEDNSGNKVTYQATFDYVDADFPFGFEPVGYTINKAGAVVESEIDSDVTPQHAAQPQRAAQRTTTSTTSSSSSAVSGDFTVEPGAVVHRADAGVIGDPEFEPTLEVDIDCASDSALIEFNNSASTVHARFDVLVYHGAAETENLVELQSGSEIVDPGDVAVYGRQIPPPRGETLTLVVTAAPQKDDLDLGFEPVVVWNQAGVDCPNGFVVLVEIQADCDVGGVRITLDNGDSEVVASFTVSLIVDEETSTIEIHQVDAGVIKEMILPLPEDVSWSIEWTAGDAEDLDQSFDGFTDPQDFDCEPLRFEPVLTVSHACSPLGDSATFLVDNSDSGVDAIVGLYDGSELIWGPETVEAGTVMDETTIPATGVESVTIVITAGVEAASYSPTRVKEILECPEVNVTAFDCAAYPALIQVIGETGVGMHVKQLDIASGEYTAIYSLPFDRTPAFGGMNAVGINPVDFIAYGLMKLPGSDGSSYLVRFDKENVAFLARVPEHSAAGGVDDDGIFVWEQGRNLYAIYGIAEMEGFASPDDALDLSEINPLATRSLGGALSDIATVKADLGDGEGSYVMGVTNQRQLGIYRYDDPTGVWVVDLFEADESNDGIPTGAFGAAWSNDGRIYFAANSGHGVYEVLIDTIDLNAGTATARWVASSEPTGWNDGMSCVGIPTCIPDTFGAVYGYVWVDWEASGDRTAIEDGVEEHVAGTKVTLVNTTTYHDSDGNPCYGPGEFQMETTTGAGPDAGTDSGDFGWYLADIPVFDSFGNEMHYEVHFDYVDAVFPDGFTPTGYTNQLRDDVTENETDSDARPVKQSNGPETLAISGDFTLTADQVVHRPDAGVVGELIFDPEAKVEVDCATERALVELNNSASTADATYTVDVYHGDVADENRISEQSGIQVVSAGDIAYYATAIPPPVGQVLTVVVTATASQDGSDLGYEPKIAWDQSGVDCPAGFAVQVQVETDCNAGGTQITLGTPGSDLGARFTLTLVVDGVGNVFEYDLGADDNHSLTLPIEEDAEWHLEWVATDDSGLDRTFAGTSTQRVFDCELPGFDPAILTGHACTASGGVVTVLVDNRASDLDATVEIRLGSELVWGPAVVDAGAISNIISVPAVDLDTLRIWASPVGADTATSVMAEETVNCPTFDPDALVTVDCGVGRAMLVLDNSVSTVDAWFTVEVHRGGVDWASRVEDESGAQLVPAGTTDTYTEGLPLISGEMLSVEISADAYREGVSLGFDPVVVWNQSVTDCPNGFAVQIYVASDCAADGAKAVFSTVGSEVTVIATANTVVDGNVVGVNTYELSAGNTVDVPLLVPDGSEWSLQWSVADAADPSRVFQGATTTQTLNCEPDEPAPTDPGNPFDPDAVVTVDCGVGRALLVLDNSASTVDAWFTVEVHRGGVDWASRVEDESGAQLVPAGTTDTYTQGLPLISGEMLSVEISAEAYREGVLLGFDPVVVSNQSVTDCSMDPGNPFDPDALVTVDCGVGRAVLVLDNSVSTVDAWFTVEVHRGGIDWASRVEDESKAQLVPAGTTDTYTEGLPLISGEVLSVEISADAYREDVSLGFDPVVVWNQSVTDCPNGFAVQIHVAADCAADGAKAVFSTVGSEVTVIATANTVVDGNVVGVNTYELLADNTVDVPLQVPDGSEWSLQWSVADAENPSRSFQGATTTQTLNCEPDEPLPTDFTVQIYAAADCALGGAKAVFSTVGSEVTVIATANTVVDGNVVGVNTYELLAGNTVDVPLQVPDGSEWSLQWSVADAENPSRSFQGATTTQTLNCGPDEPRPVVTTTTTGEEASTREPLIGPTNQDERCCDQDEPCDQCCWPLWWFLLVVLALLVGLLALIGFLVFAVISLSRHGGGCCGPDDRGRNRGSSESDGDQGVPGAPLDLGFERKENSIKFKWNRAETGNRPTGYLIEGRIGNDWVDILNMIGGETRVAIRASEAEGVNAWRVSGANENGRGRASEEALVERSIISIAAFG